MKLVREIGGEPDTSADTAGDFEADTNVGDRTAKLTEF